jgi:hypothetical protein
MVSIPVPDIGSSAYRTVPGTGYDGVVRVSTRTVYGTGIGDCRIGCGADPAGRYQPDRCRRGRSQQRMKDFDPIYKSYWEVLKT